MMLFPSQYIYLIQMDNTRTIVDVSFFLESRSRDKS